MSKLIQFTKVWGRLRVLIDQAKKQLVPKKNTIIFHGYTVGPIAFRLCPAITNGAPVHCRMSLISNFFILVLYNQITKKSTIDFHPESAYNNNMDIKVKRLKQGTWEMHLIEPPESPGLGSYFDIKAVQQLVREVADGLGVHDRRVDLIHKELTASEYTMYSRQAYDRWHWYDKNEMEKFITHFLLKHGEK